MDISSLATHIKCGSDLSKMYPGVKISEEDMKAAESLITGKNKETIVQERKEKNKILDRLAKINSENPPKCCD